MHLEEAILKKGGAILMALFNGEVAGTVAFKKVTDEAFEFTKMAPAIHLYRKQGFREVPLEPGVY
jgi:hypothetical protein